MLQTYHHTRSALSFLVFRIVENLTTNNSTDNLAVQTSFLMSMLLIHACQEKNIFSNLFLARRNPKSKLFGMNAVIQSGCRIGTHGLFSSPKSDYEMKWRHSSCIQLSLRCRGQKLTTRPWEQTGQRKLTSHPTFFTQNNFLHTRSMIEVSWLRKARIESTSTTSVALFTLRTTTSIVEEWQRRTRERLWFGKM